MARCGCSGAQPCSCFIEAGAGITVTGSGSPGTPYIVAVDGNSTTVSDTATINMSILGSGTSGDPYVIFGSVKLDPDVDNVLAATANGLYLDCATIADCVGGVGETTVDDTSTIDLTLTGTGTTVDPYIITAAIKLSVTAGNILTTNGTGIYLSCDIVRDCFSAGDGLNYDSATGEFEVQISTDVANTAVIGTDGGVYVPPGSGVVVDCGLDGVGTLGDPLVVNTGGSIWPFACDEDQGAAVYCGADSVLRVDPEKFVIYESLTIDDGSGQTDTFAAEGAGPTDVSGPVDVVITNPSNCREMVIFLETGVEHGLMTYSGAGENDCLIGAHFVILGDIIADEDTSGHQRWRFGGGATIAFDSQRSGERFVYTLAAGGSATVSLYSSMDNVVYNGSALLSTWSTYLDIEGHSL